MSSEQYLEIRKYITDNITKVYPNLQLHNNVPFYEDVPYMMEQTSTTIKHLIVGLNDFDYFEKKITSRGYQCTLELTQIEEILIPLENKYLASNPSIINRRTISFNNFTDSKKNEVWNSFKKYADVDLATNPEVLDALCDHYIEVIGKHFIPFWEKYSDLQYINDEIIDKAPDIYNYLDGMYGFKKLIIMRICKNKNYEQHKAHLINLKEKALEKDREGNAAYWNLFAEMVQIIESKYVF